MFFIDGELAHRHLHGRDIGEGGERGHFRLRFARGVGRMDELNRRFDPRDGRQEVGAVVKQIQLAGHETKR